MTAEYAIFNDEGCIERDFSDEDLAQSVKDNDYGNEPGVYVAEMCPDHDEQPREFCEECEEEG
jgi:hypothetical protein